MAVKGKKPVLKFRGVVRGQLRRADRSLSSLVNRQAKESSQWMTPDEEEKVQTVINLIGVWLAQKTS